MENIVLIGLSGCGKSTLGKALAAELNMDFIDMDDVATAQSGLSINDIFAQFGEPYFRDLEAKIALELSATTNKVIATGGGAILRSESVRALRSSGRLIFIDRPPRLIISDLKCSGRPLLKDGAEQLYELSRARRPLYFAATDDVFLNTGDKKTAISDLLSLLREPKKPGNYAVIGDPIGHTLSPIIHNTVFAELGIAENYAAVHVNRGELADFVAHARETDIRGFNITAPHKADIIPFLDEVDADALLSNAVNTVVVKNGKFHGYNTDMQGLSLAIKDCGRSYKNSVVVVLGSGGAAGGIALKAVRDGAKALRVLGRRSEATEAIIAPLRGLSSCELMTADLSDASLEKAVSDCDILINTIPLGMTGAAEDSRSFDYLRAAPKTMLACDLIYSPPRTAFLKAAEALGCDVLNGLPMLVYQAILADEYYSDRAIKLSEMYELIMNRLFEYEGD